jgi:hypothetical protein
MRKSFLALLFAACASGHPLDAPLPPRPPPLPHLACALPPVPEMPKIVGYPSATTIYVTTYDLGEMLRATAQMTEWLRAAAKCIGTP